MRHWTLLPLLAAIAIAQPALGEASQAAVPLGELDPDQVRHRFDLPDRNRLSEDMVSLRVATRRGDATGATLLVRAEDGTWATARMKRFASTPQGDYYRAYLHPRSETLAYGFWLEGKRGGHFYGPDGLSELPSKPFLWNWRNQPAFTTPDWAHGTIFYQIFPERFANGDPRNDPPGALPWGGKPANFNFFGGDLKGVGDHLDHLSALGIEAIYFNPLFEATSNHKYNTTDYLRIDPHFGTNDEFKRLSKEIHQHGMRIMLDGVFNHTGTNFWAFQEASLKGPKSRYWRWYTFDGFPVVAEPKPNYRAWWGFSSLPQLNSANREVREYLLDVGRHWLAPGLADAWRLDVPNEVPRDFWGQFRTAVRETRRDALIVGEIWDNASPWLQGDNFDSVMNYRFRSAVLDFIAFEKTDAVAFGEALDQIRADYGDQVEPVLLNLIDSHDTARFLHDAHEDKAKLRLAALLQMTTPGMPCVYYGDEVGMTGGGDPDNRRCMVWDARQQDQALFRDYQALIRLRRAHAALKEGDFERLATPAARVFAFTRTKGAERLMVVVNAGATPFDVSSLGRAIAGTVFGDLRSNQLAPKSGAVFRLR